MSLGCWYGWGWLKDCTGCPVTGEGGTERYGLPGDAYGELLPYGPAENGDWYGGERFPSTRCRFAGGTPPILGDMAPGDCWYDGGEKAR